jgi:acyl-CoA dehydrogenase
MTAMIDLVPAVLSANVITHRARQVVNYGMDIVGGKGICMGPNNFLAVPT